MNTSTGSKPAEDAGEDAGVELAGDEVAAVAGVQTFITKHPSSTPYVSLLLKYCRHAGPNCVPSSGSAAYGLEPQPTGLVMAASGRARYM